ncbi:hypothetical protein [Paraburkholderia phenoliruptrix]|nr:hypothetical protein [Paraburkholderia phenoliruptrix]
MPGVRRDGHPAYRVHDLGRVVSDGVVPVCVAAGIVKVNLGL